jgi:hypothetical protein
MHFLLRIARGSFEHSLTSINYTLWIRVLQGFFGRILVFFVLNFNGCAVGRDFVHNTVCVASVKTHG